MFRCARRCLLGLDRAGMRGRCRAHRRMLVADARARETAGRSETFVSIDTENITDEQLDRLEEFAVAAEASGRPLHAIVSTDGDSDRRC